MQIYGAHVQVLVFRLFSASVDLTCDAPHNQRNGNEKSSRIAGETARGTPMFRFSKPETPRAALFVFLRNETRAKSGFVSYVSIFLCFDRLLRRFQILCELIQDSLEAALRSSNRARVSVLGEFARGYKPV